jgi:hypothetical protein
MTSETTLRDRLHHLIDETPDDRLVDALYALVDLMAPEDDEPETAEDLAALERGRDAYRRGETIEHAEVVRALEQRRAERRS